MIACDHKETTEKPVYRMCAKKKNKHMTDPIDESVTNHQCPPERFLGNENTDFIIREDTNLCRKIAYML